MRYRWRSSRSTCHAHGHHGYYIPGVPPVMLDCGPKNDRAQSAEVQVQAKHSRHCNSQPLSLQLV